MAPVYNCHHEDITAIVEAREPARRARKIAGRMRYFLAKLAGRFFV